MDRAPMLAPSGECKQDLKLIVRVKTSQYISAGKMVWKKELYPLKSKSSLSWGDVFIDPWEDMNIILNIDDVSDGGYIVSIVNCSTDWETGYLDDWEYKLVPYEGEL